MELRPVLRGISSFLSLMLMVSLAVAADAKLIGESKKHVPLFELYTSEGCSSCPPADQYFSSFKKRPGLWKDFVPVVFHVDYWNDLGWKDGLSSDRATARQVAITRTWKKASVYTPGVIVDGREWRDWHRGKFPLSSLSDAIEMKLSKISNTKFQVELKGIKTKHKIYVALLGMGIKIKVAAGENNGRELKHDFSVLEWNAASLEKDGKVEIELKNQTHSELAAVAWVEDDRVPIALQATGGFFSSPIPENL